MKGTENLIDAKMPLRAFTRKMKKAFNISIFNNFDKNKDTHTLSLIFREARNVKTSMMENIVKYERNYN